MLPHFRKLLLYGPLIHSKKYREDEKGQSFTAATAEYVILGESKYNEKNIVLDKRRLPTSSSSCWIYV